MAGDQRAIPAASTRSWRRDRVLVAGGLALVLWLGGCLLFAAQLAIDRWGISCGELTPRSSDYGTSRWHWSTLSSSCTWDIPPDASDPESTGGKHTDGPSYRADVELLLLIAWPLTTARLIIAASPPRSAE